MKKQFAIFPIIIFLALGCFFFADSAYAETEVSGNITDNTTWTLADSPYLVTSTVQVLEGVNLIIESGVTVNFNQSTALVIGGKLVAIGAENQKITFHGGTVTFTDKSIGAVTDQNNNYISGSIIKNAIIESGKAIGLNIDSSPFISNNVFRNYTPNTAGLYVINLHNSNSVIINNLIDNNSGTAMNVYFSGATIKNNYSGLYLQFQANPKIQYNNIFENGGSRGDNIRMAQNTDIKADYNYLGATEKSLIDASMSDYYDNIGLGKIIYEPYALTELKFDGTDTFSQPSACTSWVYSEWSSCSNSGQQTRSIISSSPSSCVGGSPVLMQSCTYVAPTCTSWTYSDWSTCQSNDTKTRTIISSSPNGCSSGNPVLTQSCTYTPPTCTSWAFSSWGACADSQQTRTITSSQPTNCVGGNPVLHQGCDSTPLCTENNWTSILTPTNCPNNGQQTKKWSTIGQCQGGISHPAEEIISCNYQTPTCTSFVYSDWGVCSSSGVQSRTTLSTSPSGCTGGNPVLSQNCNYNSGEILNKNSIERTEDNSSANPKNQNSQTTKESETSLQVAEQRRSEVASAVQEILQVAENDNGIGQQVKIIAQTQTQNQEKLEISLQKVQSRSGFAKFFVGPNYGEINNVKKLLEQNREQIKQFGQIKNQLANQDDQQKLTEQVQLLEQSNQEIENSLNVSQNGFSLFGWIFRFFAK